jgi:hypothetical protein
VIEVGEHVLIIFKDSTKWKTQKEWIAQEFKRVILNIRVKLFPDDPFSNFLLVKC